MKQLLILLLFVVFGQIAMAQSDPTQRINKNLRGAGRYGLSEAGLTRQDSLAIWQAISTGLASSTSLSGQVSSLSAQVGQRVLQNDFNTYKTNAALSENSQNQIIATKANASDVYAKSQTYSQAETDAKKPDFEIVSTFSEAQTKSVSGKPKVFILTNDTPYGGSSVVIWSGSSFTVLPGIPRTN